MRLPGTYSGNLKFRQFVCPDRMNRAPGIHIVVAWPELPCIFTRSIRAEGNGHPSFQYRYAFICGVCVRRHDESIVEPETHRKQIGSLGVSCQDSDLTT